MSFQRHRSWPILATLLQPGRTPRRPEPLHQGASLAVVFVVAADPELEPVALVAAFRRPVEDRGVAHQELDPAAPARIGGGAVASVPNEQPEPDALGQLPHA